MKKYFLLIIIFISTSHANAKKETSIKEIDIELMNYRVWNSFEKKPNSIITVHQIHYRKISGWTFTPFFKTRKLDFSTPSYYDLTLTDDYPISAYEY